MFILFTTGLALYSYFRLKETEEEKIVAKKTIIV